VVNINGVGMFLGEGPNGIGDDSTDALMRRIDYAVQLIGPEHVGPGLDYNGNLMTRPLFMTKRTFSRV